MGQKVANRYGGVLWLGTDLPSPGWTEYILHMCRGFLEKDVQVPVDKNIHHLFEREGFTLQIFLQLYTVKARRS